MTETLTLETNERILTIALHRPARLNAFTVTMANELIDSFVEADQSDAIDAVVVTGSGRAFCSGMDLTGQGNVFGLNERLCPTPQELREGLDEPLLRDGARDPGGRVSLAIYDCGKPVIAAINGPAIGVGATMTLPMDARLMASNATMGFVFGRLGITPEACSTWFLPRLVGVEAALDLLYTAEILDADQAFDLGLVRRPVASGCLLEEAHALARRFVTGRSRVATRLTRQLIYRNLGVTNPVAAHISESLALLHTSKAHGREGVRAFLDKRPPDFDTTTDPMPEIFPNRDRT